MATDSELKLVISAVNRTESAIKALQNDFNKFQKNIGSAEKEVQQMNKSMTAAASSAKTLTAAFVGLFAVDKLKNFAGGVLKASGELEQMSVNFEVLLGSAQEADKFLKQLSDFALKTPFTIKGVRETALQLKAYGLEQEEIIPTMRMLGNLALGNEEKFNRLQYAYGQVRAANKLYGTELRQFTETGIPIIDALAAHFNITKEEVRDFVSDGKVSFKDLQESLSSLTAEGGMFFGLMEKGAQTLPGILSNIGDAWTRMQEEFSNTLAYDNLKNLTGATADAANETGVLVKMMNFLGNSIGTIMLMVKDMGKALVAPFKLVAETTKTAIDIVIDGFGSIGHHVDKWQEKISDSVDFSDDMEKLNKFWSGENKNIEETANAIEKSSNKISNSTQKTNKEVEKAIKVLESWKNKYFDIERTVELKLFELEKDHEKSSSKISESIDNIKNKLSDLKKEYDKTMQSQDTSVGEEVLAQEKKIAEIKKEIKETSGVYAGTPEAMAFEEKRQQLKKEEKVLKEFLENSKDFEDEISEARRRDALTDFERFLEDSKKKREETKLEYEEKSNALQAKLDEENAAFLEEQAIYKAQRDEYHEIQEKFKEMANVISTGNAFMVDDAKKTADALEVEYERIKDSLQRIKMVGYSSSGTPLLNEPAATSNINSSPLNTTTNSSNITNNSPNVSTTNNIIINSNQDAKSIADAVAAKLSRDIKLQSLGQ